VALVQRWPYQYEVALPRPAALQRLHLPALQLQVRLASPDTRRDCRAKQVAAYMKLYGKESRDSDHESDGSNGTGRIEEEDGEEDGDGGGEEH
jgi:hypothetical protein